MDQLEFTDYWRERLVYWIEVIQGQEQTPESPAFHADFAQLTSIVAQAASSSLDSEASARVVTCLLGASLGAAWELYQNPP